TTPTSLAGHAVFNGVSTRGWNSDVAVSHPVAAVDPAHILATATVGGCFKLHPLAGEITFCLDGLIEAAGVLGNHNGGGNIIETIVHQTAVVCGFGDGIAGKIVVLIQGHAIAVLYTQR